MNMASTTQAALGAITDFQDQLPTIVLAISGLVAIMAVIYFVWNKFHAKAR